MLKNSERTGVRNALLVSSALISVLAIGAVAPAYADDGVETITVTAEKRAQSIETVPTSITAFSGDELEAAGITDFSDIARMAPNVTLSTANNLRNTSINIRGQGTSPVQPGARPRHQPLHRRCLYRRRGPDPEHAVGHPGHRSAARSAGHALWPQFAGG